MDTKIRRPNRRPIGHFKIGLQGSESHHAELVSQADLKIGVQLVFNLAFKFWCPFSVFKLVFNLAFKFGVHLIKLVFNLSCNLVRVQISVQFGIWYPFSQIGVQFVVQFGV